VVSGLSKRFGEIRAVDNLSFTVEPGSVTAFLGPNGAGKTTTLRCILGLVAPTSGTATIGGRRYVELTHPTDQVGAVLEAASFHPARTGGDHLWIYATVNGYADRRIDVLLEMVGLTDVADRPVGGYSQGMRQRLALANALLGDPQVLVLDEPGNGLDPEGIAWLRHLIRSLADDGRTVLVSSHLLAEVEQVADRVVIINHGRLVREGTLAELSAGVEARVLVRSPQADKLAAALASFGARVQRTGPAELAVTGIDAAGVGHVAFTESIELHGLATHASDLERVFFALTSEVRG
jgi:ABC-2 type transport system ATP-binding protein